MSAPANAVLLLLRGIRSFLFSINPPLHSLHQIGPAIYPSLQLAVDTLNQSPDHAPTQPPYELAQHSKGPKTCIHLVLDTLDKNLDSKLLILIAEE